MKDRTEDHFQMLQIDSLRRASSRSALAFLSLSALALAFGLFSADASAQWATFVNETTTRLSNTALEGGLTTRTDNQEKDFAWGDLDHDGDIDLVCVRKFPFTNPGGKRNMLLMNDNGVLVDRASTKANTALGVPGGQGVSQGFLDETNDRDVVMADFNNDGWLDVATATTLSDGLPRYISHPRIYMNMGEVSGVWQGLRYEYNRFPQLFSVVDGSAQAPRFCSVAAGDVTGDGYADLYFGDYDGGFGTNEPPNNDVDNKLMVNGGAGNPGVFADGSGAPRFPNNFTYPTVGSQTFNWAKFGAASVIADMNGDGIKDIVKQTSLQAPVHVGVVTNSPSNPGVFNNYKVVYGEGAGGGAAYFVSEGDLNNDGRLDLVMSDDGADRYLLNTGNDASGAPNFTSVAFQSDEGAGFDDGFASQSIIIDLDNDGFRDVLICDVDVDELTSACDARRLHIYRNLGNLPNVTLREQLQLIIPDASLRGTHNVAVFDLNNDGWKDLVIGRCETTDVWMNTGSRLLVPTPVTFVAPSGSSMPVTISTSQVASVVPGSAKLFVSVNGGAFTESPLIQQVDEQYLANFPAGACGDEIRYYVSAQTTSGGPVSTLTNPVGAPASFYSAIRGLGLNATLNQEFEGRTTGWSANSVAAGQWEAADPNGTTTAFGLASPEDDATPTPGVKAFITQNGLPGGLAGAADVDGGPTQLTSPTLDASTGQYRISYAYWFFTDAAVSDSLTVEVSNNNGTNWTTVKSYTARSGGWVRDSFRIASFVSQSNQVRVRFSALDGATNTTVEAGIDDFRLEKVQCALPCVADINGDTFVNVTDLLSVISAWGTCTGCPADTNQDGNVNVTDLLAVISAWGNCPQ